MRETGLVNKMRTDFFKEIQVLRDLLNSQTFRTDLIEDYLEVHFFQESEGLEPEVRELLNEKLSCMRLEYN